LQQINVAVVREYSWLVAARKREEKEKKEKEEEE